MPTSDVAAHALFRDDAGTLLLASAHGIFALQGDSAPTDSDVLPPPRDEPAIKELRQAGLILAPATETRLAQASVKVLGSGRLARHIVEDLVSAGVRDLVLWDNEPPDLNAYDNFTRATGAQTLKSWLVARHGHDWTRLATVVNHWSKPEHRNPDVTIVATDYVETDRAITDGLLRADQVHVFARPFRRGVIVGPWVIPGRTPCIRCYDLARSIRAPLWPAALSRLTQVRQSVDRVWARWAASQVVVALGGFLDGHDIDLMGATAEICAEAPSTGMRRWGIHPECGCDLIDADRTGWITPHRE